MSRIAVRPGRRVLVGWAAAVAAGLPAVPALADSNYVGGEGAGNWSVPENWSPVGVPTAGANVNFVNADGLNRTLNYDSAAAAVALGNLTIDQTGTGTNTVEMAGSALSTSNLYLAWHGSGSFNQSGGTHTYNYLGLTVDPQSRATYTLSGGELRAADLGGSGSTAIIGYGGVGEFNQTGGLHSARVLWVGFSEGSSGTYRLSSGRLEVPAFERIGGGADPTHGGDGLFDQSGGEHVASSGLFIGGSTQSGSGTYRLSGDGVLTVSSFESVQRRGTFEQSGGTHTVNGPLDVVGSSTAPAVYRMSAGTLTAGWLTVAGASSSTYDLSGGTATIANTVTIGAGGGALNLSGGSLTAGALQNNGAVTATGGTFTGGLVNGGTVRASTGAVLTVTGGTVRTTTGGVLTLTGGISGSNAASTAASRLVIETGALVTASYVRQGSLELNGSTANPPVPAPVLSIRRKADGGGTSVVGSLSIQTDARGAPLGRVDLADTALVVDYSGASPISTIRSLIAAGRAGSAWMGNGLTSSVAASSNGAGALGYAEASQVLSAKGGTFAGQAVDGTAVLVRYTLAGDASLGGVVGFEDLLALAKHYNTTDAQWADGDFNYDGVVNFADLLALAKNYGQAAPAEPVAGAPAGFEADLAAAFAQAVPEPSGVGWVVAAGAGVVARRRRRRV
jgi:hypothetical protein